MGNANRSLLAPHGQVAPARSRRVPFVRLLALCAVLIEVGGCADSLLLSPTTGPIDAPSTIRIEIPVPGRDPVEAYTTLVNVEPGAEPEAYLLILDGNNGRAERAVAWAQYVARGRAIEAWALNYPGYGRSPGRAGLAGIGPAAIAMFDALYARAGGKPVLIWGASLGSAPALHVSARRPAVAGLILTNPPPLRQLVLNRYGWWNLWLVAIPVSLGVPADLDSLANASKVTAPALVTSADADGVVPPAYQKMVIDALAGPTHVVTVPGGGHDTPASTGAPRAWEQGLEWLWGQVEGGRARVER